MNKIWLIIKNEYRRHVFRKRFLVSLLSLPIVVLVMVGVALMVANSELDTTPVGYVDPSNNFDLSLRKEEEEGFLNAQIPFILFADPQKAQFALESGGIQAYFVLSENFPQDPNVEMVYLEEPQSSVESQFTDVIQQNLMGSDQLDPQVIRRLTEGSLITVSSLDGSREMSEDQWYLVFTPYIAGVLFIVVVMSSGGYLLQAVVEEKENRTMEIVITSVTPNQLMTGKIIGNIAVGLTQLLVWLVFGWLGLKVGGQFWPILQDFSLSPSYIFTSLLLLLPSFVMVAALMATIGSSMTETREAQQISSIFSLLITMPFYVTSTIMMQPNGLLAMVLSYFPFSSPLTILMRMSLTVIPTYQLAIHITVLVICAVFAIWVAGRAFRLGMLQYGKKITLKEIFGKGSEA